MNSKSIKSRVVDLCANTFKNLKVEEELLDCLDFVDDLGMDSATMITLIIKIEEEFSITIPDDYIIYSKFSKLKDIIKIIEEQLSI